jgi:S1-C subfamily serine protease
MVRGFDDPIYDRFYREYCELTHTTAVPLNARPWNHIRRAEDAIWVIHSNAGDGQGTGFFLADIGLVTCQHVLGGDLVAYTPSRPSQRFPVSVRVADPDIDLAILDFPSTPPIEFEGRYGHSVHVGDPFIVRGYPDFNPGTSLWTSDCVVTGFRTFGSVSRIVTSLPIAKGASGSPVCDNNDRVIGVAATNPHLYNSIIPIIEIWTLIGMTI